MKSLLGASVALFVVSCLSAIVLRGQEPPAAAASTVWDKVYTEAQATRGKDAYMTECSACHSEDLGGSGYAPALKGDDFTFTWNDKSVGDFFDRVRKLMPPDNPGSLPAERYRDIIAFILQENKYPSGDQELSSESPALRQIKITKGN
jgi:polar amino acid transport system substrate-binding protein